MMFVYNFNAQFDIYTEGIVHILEEDVCIKCRVVKDQ